MPTKIVGRMNGPALPVSCAIELQCSYVVKANILRDWLPRKAKEKLTKVSDCQQQGRVSQSARSG